MGVTRGEMFTMVATAPPPPPYRHASPLDGSDVWPADADNIIYDEVPDGLITVADAVAKYKVRHNTLNVALFRGVLPKAGRLRGRRPGKMDVLIPEVALRLYLGLDPVAPEGEDPANPHKLPSYDRLPEAMITLTDAAGRFDVTLRQLRNWVRTERLTRMGYLRGKTRRGDLLLLEAEVRALVETVG